MILGLKTIDLVQKTLDNIGTGLDFNTFANSMTFDDQSVYQMLTNKKSDAVFQLESDLFKGVIGNVKPNNLNDITAITSICRPGPLAAGFAEKYAHRKNGEEEITPFFRNMDHLLDETYGLMVYQETAMKIGVEAFGFNAGQSDSILRKIVAKKKKDKLEMLRRMIKYGKVNTEGPEGWHDNPNMPWYDPNGKQYGDEICGGIKNGYSEKEIDDFWNSFVEFGSYAFNKSHACTYSALSYTCAYLKYYYPVEFFSAVLSVQSEDKIEKYSNVCEQEGIKIIAPDINISNRDFTPNAKDKTIYYGLSSIKGVGNAAIEEILEQRPFMEIEEIFEKVSKKAFNKRVAEAMAKSGALDSFDIHKNRFSILNKIHEIRKDKDYELLVEDAYTKEECIEFEKQVLSAPITYKPWWTTIKADQKIEEDAVIVSYSERPDKKGNLMAFAKLNINSCEIESIIFSATYLKSYGVFDSNINPVQTIRVKGVKDDKGKLIVKKILPIQDAFDFEKIVVSF